ncbi:hypothetical protein CL628_00120 [bacterium]|nr:hypothetical protein [bacterium]
MSLFGILALMLDAATSPPVTKRRRFPRWGYGLIAIIILILAGLGIYLQPFLSASLILDQPFYGSSWSPLVRHSTTHNDQEIFCYDEGSQFCERILTRITGNPDLQFARQRTLGFLFSARLDLQSVPHQELYSCVNLREAARGVYQYRITTDRQVCRDISAYPYSLGKFFNNPGDVEFPLPLYQEGPWLATSAETGEGELPLIGHVAGAPINQVPIPTVAPPSTGPLCVVAEANCKAGSTNPLCAPAVTLCDFTPVAARLALDVNNDSCVGEADMVLVRDSIGEAATNDKQRFDVNGDGEINILDVLVITQFIDNPANSALVCGGGGSTGSPSTWQNPDNQFDVNRDGAVNLADVESLYGFFDDEEVRGDEIEALLFNLPIDFGDSTPASGNPFDRFFTSYGYLDVDGDGEIGLDDLNVLYDQLNGDLPVASLWQNPVNQFDVNSDGTVSPLDVLQVVNVINRGEQLRILKPTFGNVPPPYLDVDGDGSISQADADAIIDHLRS